MFPVKKKAKHFLVELKVGVDIPVSYFKRCIEGKETVERSHGETLYVLKPK